MKRLSKAFIAAEFEHPTRKAFDKTVPQLHAEVAASVLKALKIRLSIFSLALR